MIRAEIWRKTRGEREGCGRFLVTPLIRHPKTAISRGLTLWRCVSSADELDHRLSVLQESARGLHFCESRWLEGKMLVDLRLELSDKVGGAREARFCTGMRVERWVKV